MKDGGPAFPFKRSNEKFLYPNTEFPGMSLRDYFAAKALTGFVLAHCIANGPTMSAEDIGTSAFKVADAMLKTREELISEEKIK